MKRILAATALLATVACARDPARRNAVTLAQVTQAFRAGTFENAQAIAERGLASAPPGSTWAWTLRLYRGEILIRRGKLAEAAPELTASLPPDPAFDPLRARQKYLAALMLLGQKNVDLEGALSALGEARRLAPAESELQLEIGSQEGQVLARLGRPREAEQTLDAVIHQAEARGDRFMQAHGWNNLGMVALTRGRWDEAVTRFDRVLSFADLEQTTVFAAALINAGACYARLGEFDRALKFQQRAVAYHADHGPPVSHVSALGEIGNTYVQQGEPEAALPYYQKALAVARDANVPAAVWAGNLAAAQIDLGRWDEAERFNDEAKRLKAVQHLRTTAYNDLNTAEIALGRGRLDEADRRFQDLLGDPAVDVEVRWQVQAGLAKIALARARPAEAGRHFEAALGSIEQTQTNLIKTDFRLTFLTRLIAFYQSYIDALVDQGKVERALEIADSSRGRVLATRTNWPAPPKATAAAMRQVAARSQAVLLSYWLGRERSYLWVIGPGGIHLVRLPAAAEIAALVRQYNSVIGDALADPLASSGNAGDRLYDLLIKPASAWLTRGSRVILVADGALHGLNFETLPVAGATRHYWIEDVELQTAPGLSMLTAPRPRPAGPPSLLLIGDPVPPPAEFPPLKYASTEIANIASHFSNAAVIYTGAQASPAAYMGATPGRFRLVHFATHASANLESPLDSAVILSGPEAAFKLYARDVADVPLRAELVTVSACRSAGERIYTGEGLVGFAWAFLRAGSSRVIAGLWDVDDRSTSELMDQLYAGLAAGHSPAQALRAAKLALLTRGANYRKPYYWGPFQLFTVVP
jgi:CHAT domain-containing protein/Tfp pilus assembly protein PilF